MWSATLQFNPPHGFKARHAQKFIKQAAVKARSLTVYGQRNGLMALFLPADMYAVTAEFTAKQQLSELTSYVVDPPTRPAASAPSGEWKEYQDLCLQHNSLNAAVVKGHQWFMEVIHPDVRQILDPVHQCAFMEFQTFCS